jgi:electron transfer flavoprotein beta subunit
MEILVCVKRVPTVGGKIVLTPDGQAVDTRMSGFTISPHEECAVEEAVRLIEAYGGSVTVATLGPAESVQQLRDALALGAQRAIHLQTSGSEEFGPIATASALASAARSSGPYDLVLMGNEASDTGDYQVGIRVAHLLGWPVVTGIKSLTVSGSSATASREYRGVTETFDIPLPAVVTVKEGINLPRYPSLPGRLRAKKALVETSDASLSAEGLRMMGLRVPETVSRQAAVLDGVPALVRVLEELGVLS